VGHTRLGWHPFTFPEVKTCGRCPVGGHRIEDEAQVLNQQGAGSDSWNGQGRQFLGGQGDILHHSTVSSPGRGPEWGTFRNGQVGIAGTSFKPPAHQELDLSPNGNGDRHGISNRLKKAWSSTCSAPSTSFFYDGNKRTSRLMMNGVLLMKGHDRHQRTGSPAPRVQREERYASTTRSMNGVMSFCSIVQHSGPLHRTPRSPRDKEGISCPPHQRHPDPPRQRARRFTEKISRNEQSRPRGKSIQADGELPEGEAPSPLPHSPKAGRRPSGPEKL
jgi:hypothetical protein